MPNRSSVVYEVSEVKGKDSQFGNWQGNEAIHKSPDASNEANINEIDKDWGEQEKEEVAESMGEDENIIGKDQNWEGSRSEPVKRNWIEPGNAPRNNGNWKHENIIAKGSWTGQEKGPPHGKAVEQGVEQGAGFNRGSWIGYRSEQSVIDQTNWMKQQQANQTKINIYNPTRLAEQGQLNSAYQGQGYTPQALVNNNETSQTIKDTKKAVSSEDSDEDDEEESTENVVDYEDNVLDEAVIVKEQENSYNEEEEYSKLLKQLNNKNKADEESEEVTHTHLETTLSDERAKGDLWPVSAATGAHVKSLYLTTAQVLTSGQTEMNLISETERAASGSSTVNVMSLQNLPVPPGRDFSERVLSEDIYNQLTDAIESIAAQAEEERTGSEEPTTRSVPGESSETEAGVTEARVSSSTTASSGLPRMYLTMIKNYLST